MQTDERSCSNREAEGMRCVRRRRAARSTALALSLLLPGLAFAERPKLVTQDDAKGRAHVDGCRPACSEWVRFTRSRPRAIVEATLSPSGQHFFVWSRAEGRARELDFFEVPDISGGTARRLGHLVPGFGGELVWLQGERVLHVWGCGTGCQRVRVYALGGATLFVSCPNATTRGASSSRVASSHQRALCRNCITKRLRDRCRVPPLGALRGRARLLGAQRTLTFTSS